MNQMALRAIQLLALPLAAALASKGAAAQVAAPRFRHDIPCRRTRRIGSGWQSPINPMIFGIRVIDRTARFDPGIAHEVRHTVGGRIWRQRGNHR
jgi:hypothetical protein